MTRRAFKLDLSTTIAGIKLKNPLMPASGPLTGDYKKMMYISGLGVGGMVTKTISTSPAIVPRPCIYGEKDLIMNSELWSELSPQIWIDKILPELKRDSQIPLIVSAGYTKEDMQKLIPQLDKFADAFEISTHYVGKDLSSIAETVKAIRQNTNKPIFMKMSPHIPDPVEFARMVKENGGDGIVAINSLGPTMKINIKDRKVLLGNSQGLVWTSGPVIKPLALAIVNMIKEAVPEITVIGAGGIKTADDVIEFLLAGADAVQMLSAALITGKDLYEKILNDLPEALTKYNFTSVREVVEARLEKGSLKLEPGKPLIDEKKCTLCKLCEKVCPYFAISIGQKVEVDPEECFGCGLCQSRCPTHAISNVI